MNLSKFRFASVTLGLLSAPLMAAPSTAQGMVPGMGMGHGGGMMGMHGSPFMMLLKQANLSSSQQQQVQLILNSDRARMEGIHKQLFAVHEQIAGKLFGPGAVTSADMKPLVTQASKLESELNQSMADTAIAIRNVLTADQIKHLAEVQQKLHSLHAQMQGLMGHPGPDDDEN